MNFGFVGLGQMGAPMAENLAHQYNLRVFDFDADTLNAVSSRGHYPASDITEMSNVDVLILCLPGSDAVESVLFDDQQGLASQLSAETIVVDTGTSDYSATVKIAERLQAHGIEFVDAPVSGMRARAEAGTLTMMCGGDEVIVNKLRSALSTMADNIVYMGKNGSGQLTKLINQLLFDINAAALAEILPMASKLGLNAQKMGDVINSGTGRSFASEFFIPNILNGVFDQGYPMAAAYKDLVSASAVTAEHHIPTPVLSAATATYQQALLEGHGSKDKAAMVLIFEKMLDARFRNNGES